MRAETQSRVVPYLNVAAPAALVATVPPTKAPVNVGEGGYARPTRRKALSSAAIVTPACTRTWSRPMNSMRFSRAVLRSASPIGVAPPVSEDCAPIGRTAAAPRSTAATSASLDGREQLGGVTPREMRGIVEVRGEDVGVADAFGWTMVAHRRPRTQGMPRHGSILGRSGEPLEP